jgi:hypothetical protein
VIGDCGDAHGTQEDTVAIGQLVEPICRYHRAACQLRRRTPVPLAPSDLEPRGLREHVDAGDGCRHHLLTDPVSGDDVDRVLRNYCAIS